MNKIKKLVISNDKTIKTFLTDKPSKNGLEVYYNNDKFYLNFDKICYELIGTEMICQKNNYNMTKK